MLSTWRREQGMSRVSFEHVRRGVIRHISGVGLDLDGTFVITKEWVVVVEVVVDMVVCGRRKKKIFTGTKQIVSHLRSFELVFPVLSRNSCFSPVTGGRGRKEIITSRSFKWLNMSQELRGGERETWLCVNKRCVVQC